MPEALIIDACRTARGIGKVGKGAIAGIHPQRLGSAVLKALAERNNLNTADVDDIIWGCSPQYASHSGDLGRMSALDAGYDVLASGVTLDRFCGSGLTAVNLAAASVMSGLEDVCVAGGAQVMSRSGEAGPPPLLLDFGNEHLRSLHPQVNQGICADVVATLDGIDREALDSLALRSQQRTEHAVRNGYFNGSLVPVYSGDGAVALGRDEYPRPGTTLEALAKLAPAFPSYMDYPLDGSGLTYRSLLETRYPGLAINHVHHAGNSSGVVDGAAALLLVSTEYARAHGLKARARVLAIANMGDSPTLMLNAPVPSARKVLKKAGMTLKDIDLIEVNEAFAVVVEKFVRDLDLDWNKVNVNGGAISLGHPIGATGAILIGTLLDELERRDLQTGLVTMCAGGGQAPAIIIERV